MKFETLAVRCGPEPDPATGAVVPPLHLATTFARDEAGTPLGRHTYIRESNPTQDALESALARLDGGETALVFGSGMAAGLSLLLALPGVRVVLPDDAYYGYGVAGRELLPSWGGSADFVAMEDLASLERALEKKPGLVWLESPSNPLLKVTDLAAAISMAHAAGALVVVDGTFATPALQRPLALGADVVLHAATKYMGGHSDVQGGALVFARKDELVQKVLHVRSIVGAVASPFSSWLVLRGLKTLPLRVERQSANALAVARALASHPAVRVVHYPGLASHPGHEIAKRQMSAFGGMLSFQMHGGREAALQAVARARLFIRATSLGGVESLIEHRASSEGPGSRTAQDLVRLSIGVEHADDLIADLMQALG